MVEICCYFSLPMCKRANCWEIVFPMFIWVELERVHCPVDCPACFITRLLSAAAGTQGSRQSCAASQVTHCPDTCSATGPVLRAECQVDLRRFRGHRPSLYVVLFTAQTSLGLQAWSGHVIRARILTSFPDTSPACLDLTRLEMKSGFSQVRSLWRVVTVSFSITESPIDQNKQKKI